jgi:regulator of sigma E protease
VTVLREINHSPQRVELSLDFDPSFRFDRETVTLPNSPLPVSGFGLAYRVEAVIDEANDRAKQAGIQKGDQVVAVRLKSQDADGKVKEGDWVDIKPHQWASVDAAFQGRPPYSIDLKVKRGEETQEITLEGVPDPNWGLPERGLIFDIEMRTQTATDVWDAMRLGANRTVRFIKMVYMNLGGIIFGRISAKTMSGPLTIATVSYKIAGEDFWQFLLFLGAISVNLAVFNFLPIPVLDGGHAVFLILEKILGRPVPERLFAFAMYTGLALILALMVFVLYWDIRRVIFGWF